MVHRYRDRLTRFLHKYCCKHHTIEKSRQTWKETLRDMWMSVLTLHLIGKRPSRITADRPLGCVNGRPGPDKAPRLPVRNSQNLNQSKQQMYDMWWARRSVLCHACHAQEKDRQQILDAGPASKEAARPPHLHITYDSKTSLKNNCGSPLWVCEWPAWA